MMAYGDARKRKWRGNWRMEWVASTLHTTSDHGVSSITTADAHTSAASSRLNCLPPADLNGLVRFTVRRNLVSARVPSQFNWPLPTAVLRTKAASESCGTARPQAKDLITSFVFYKWRWPPAAWLLEPSVRIPLKVFGFVSFLCCVLCRNRPLILADHSFRGVLPAMCDLETSTIRRPRL